MRTLIFCTSYAESREAWDERWGKWLRAVQGSGVRFDKLLIVDDGSPVLPHWDGLDVTEAEAPRETGGQVSLHRFRDRLGRDRNGEPFPGWYRSFGHAVRHGVEAGYDRIIHIESDAFLLSRRAVEYFNTRDRGWIGLWCKTHRFPETTLQIINRDRFAACLAFFSQPYATWLTPPGVAIEALVPFTEVNKVLTGDRYGEILDFVPFGADYVSQVRWGQTPDYYWWIKENDVTAPSPGQRPDGAALAARYARADTGDFTHRGCHYGDFLRLIDERMCPAGYLEIGTNQGFSTARVSCDAICIDPYFLLKGEDIVLKRSRLLMFQMTSDDFFAQYDPAVLLGPIDLGFLDGLHHFEALLKDFINFERHSHPGSVALLHDCLPLNTRMTSRRHAPGPDTEPEDTRGFWTGDVWRILPILREFRPDLSIVALDCPPTGLVVVGGLNSRSDVLLYAYERIVARYAALSLEEFGLDTLWNLVPLLDSQRIAEDPRTFCEQFRFRR